jgi:hypothetical protein
MADRRAVPAVLIAVLVTVALASVATSLVGLRRDAAPEVVRVPDRTRPAAEPRPETEAAAVLAAWDAERAEAWASGDVRRLRALYTPRSVAGEHDVAMLRRWLDRGLTVGGLRTQVLSLQEVSRTADRWVLTVTDRVVGAVAVGEHGAVALPGDAATTRSVTLGRRGDRWVVESVRQARPARRISATLRSWNE